MTGGSFLQISSSIFTLCRCLNFSYSAVFVNIHNEILHGLAVLHAGVDTVTVTWSLNTTEPAGADAAYKNVKVNLCYAPVSQKDRGWRKSDDDLSKDKACQFKVTQQAYAAGAPGSFVYTVAKDIPSGSYYVRAYALDASGTQVAYGQTGPNAAFDIAGITGIHASIKVAAGVFSAFSVVSLAFFFVIENRKKNK